MLVSGRVLVGLFNFLFHPSNLKLVVDSFLWPDFVSKPEQWTKKRNESRRFQKEGLYRIDH